MHSINWHASALPWPHPSNMTAHAKLQLLYYNHTRITTYKLHDQSSTHAACGHSLYPLSIRKVKPSKQKGHMLHSRTHTRDSSLPPSPSLAPASKHGSAGGNNCRELSAAVSAAPNPPSFPTVHLASALNAQNLHLNFATARPF